MKQFTNSTAAILFGCPQRNLWQNIISLQNNLLLNIKYTKCQHNSERNAPAVLEGKFFSILFLQYNATVVECYHNTGNAFLWELNALEAGQSY